MTQVNLGAALGSLGEREIETARLEEAVTAFREALCRKIPARAPLEWDTTQMKFGSALGALGERESGTARGRGCYAARSEPTPSVPMHPLNRGCGESGFVTINPGVAGLMLPPASLMASATNEDMVFTNVDDVRRRRSWQHL